MTNTTTNTRTDLVWAAGVFDIKGHINLEARSNVRNRAPSIYLISNTKNDAILHKFKSMFGGYITKQKGNTTLIWRARTHIALNCLKELLPHFQNAAHAHLSRFLLLNHHKHNFSGHMSTQQKLDRLAYEKQFQDLRKQLCGSTGVGNGVNVPTPFITEDFPMTPSLALTRANVKAPYED